MYSFSFLLYRLKARVAIIIAYALVSRENTKRDYKIIDYKIIDYFNI
jgi:hypothetical protein